MGLFDFLKWKPKTSGGDGSTPKTAVVINATSSIVGIDVEYNWLASRYGTQDKDWKLEIQALREMDGRDFDVMTIRLKEGAMKTVYFDITSFYGKF